MPKSIVIETLFPEQSYYERFRLAKEAGYDFVELDDWTRLDLSLVEGLLAEHELGVSAMVGDRDHSLYESGAEAFLEHLSQSVAVAKSFSCKNLLLRAGSSPKAGATGAMLDAVRKAERAGITLVLEPPENFDDPGEHLRTVTLASDVVRGVNSPRLRLLFNVCRQRMGGNEAVRLLRKHIDTIGYVRIADAPEEARTPDSARALAIFWETLLIELGYAGFVGFKPHPGNSPALGLEAITSVWDAMDEEMEVG